MGTKNTTTTTNAYNNASMGAYNAFQPNLMSYWMQSLNNPLGTSMFHNQLAQSNAMVNQMGANAQKNSLRNLRAGGGMLSNAGAYSSAMINRNAIASNLMRGNAFNSALNNALNTRNSAALSMAAYQPLQTGQTSVQQTSGLGTWLPQVAGMALGAASGGMTGGLSGALGGAIGMQSAPRSNPYQTLYGAQHAVAPPMPPMSGSMPNPYIPYQD